MDPAIRTALTWVVLGIGAVMTGFTALELGSGTTSTALWLGMILWPLLVIINGWILWAESRGSASRLTEGDQAETNQ